MAMLLGRRGLKLAVSVKLCLGGSPQKLPPRFDVRGTVRNQMAVQGQLLDEEIVLRCNLRQKLGRRMGSPHVLGAFAQIK